MRDMACSATPVKVELAGYLADEWVAGDLALRGDPLR
jgi:hypothetical protein